MAEPTAMVKLVSLCKRRGFIFPGSEIYDGLKGTWDYGPLGVELLRNVKNAWWQDNVTTREDIVGLDSAVGRLASELPQGERRLLDLRTTVRMRALHHRFLFPATLQARRRAVRDARHDASRARAAKGWGNFRGAGILRLSFRLAELENSQSLFRAHDRCANRRSH